MDRERNRVANGLDIPQEMREREFDLLSGGGKDARQPWRG